VTRVAIYVRLETCEKNKLLTLVIYFEPMGDEGSMDLILHEQIQ
jgi:hypothetical protein